MSVLMSYATRICGFIMLAMVACRTHATEFYVATNGLNTNPGTFEQPFQTILKGIGAAKPGDTVYIRGGTYRGQNDATVGGGSNGFPVVVQAYPNEVPVLKGSVVVTGWVPYGGNIWMKTGWTVKSQQVFVDFDANPGPPLQQIGMPSTFYTTFHYPQQVGTSLADMVAGSFHWTNNTLYVWLPDGSDPNAHTMEASTIRRILYLGKPYFHIKGLTFRHCSGSAYAEQTAAVELSTGSVIEDCDVQWCDFAGIGLAYLGTGSKAINCIASNNGDLGIGVAGSYDFTIRGCRIAHNNYRKFSEVWHAGGIKAAAMAYGVMEGNEVAANYGSGIWCDNTADSSKTMIIRDNYVHDNGPRDAAIMYEISKNGLIYNNVLVDNARRGVYISASDNTKVYNNTIIRTTGRAGIELDGIPRDGRTLTNNSVYNNIVYNDTTTNALYDFYFRKNDRPDVSGNVSDNNCVYRSSGPLALVLRSDAVTSPYTTVAAWSAASGYDPNSISADPLFVAGTGSNYAVSSSSPVVDEGKTVAEVITDYVGTVRPQGAAYDMGAFESTGAAIPVITSASSVTASVGVAFSYQITASGSPTAFAATGLPSGLSVNSTTGLIAGTPTATGVSGVTLQASNSSGTGTAALTLTVLASPPSGSVLAEETFDYATATNLNGLNGGTGWAGAWANTDNPWTATSPGLAVTSLEIESPDNCVKTATTSATRTATRAAVSAGTPYNSGVVYLGVLLRDDSGSAEYGFVQVAGDYNRNPFRINWAHNAFWGVASQSAANTWNTTVYSTVPVVQGETVLAVMKMDLSNKVAYLYINQATEGTPDAVTPVGAFGSFHSITVRTANGGASIDDLRLGTTYADVVQLPPPPPPSGVVLAEETFDYAAATNVNGLNGGTGWASAWANTDNPWTATSPGLAVTSPEIESPDNCVKTATTSATRTATRAAVSAGTPYNSGVVYLGVLLRDDSGSAEYGFVQVTGDYNRNPFRINWAHNAFWGVASQSAANTWNTTVYSTVPVVQGETVLAVMKMDLDSKVAYLYINQATEGTPDAVTPVGAFGSFHSITVRTANGGASIDDLRLGTTYADVAQIMALQATAQSVFVPAQALWQSEHFSADDLADSAISGDGADPDGDGMPNLMEYALARNPRASDDKGALRYPRDTDRLTMVYDRAKAATDVAVTVEVSDNLLGGWQSGPDHVTETPVEEDADKVTVQAQDNIPISEATQRFIRLKVTKP